MDETSLRRIFEIGETVAVEFKRCGSGIENDVYETVCSFLNRFGGDLFLGVLDDGTVVGIPEKAAPEMVKNFISCVSNPDRYDDREVIRTNLIESYDCLMAFAAKHLPDRFFLEGDQRKSLRTIICREMIANTLIHREFTSSYQAKFVIEQNRVYLENANRAVQNAVITPENLEPYPKNPIIASFFRTVGLADQLGSGVRNLYKYCRFYSGEDPQFVEGDIFRIIVPVNDIFADYSDTEAGKGDSKNIAGAQVGTQVSTRVSTQVNDHYKSMEKKILDFCKQPKSKAEIAAYCGYKSIKSLSQHYIRPLLDAGSLKMTIPDKPNSRLQKYVSAKNEDDFSKNS